MKRIIIILSALVICVIASAQNSRDYIKNSMKSWGTCRNVAITDTGGDIALNYQNQYSYSGIPTGLANAIKSLHDKKEFIDDVQLTEAGNWLVLYGNNGVQWSNIPDDLEAALREFNNNREVITSATFNDNGNWILISTEHIRASSPNIYEWIQEGMDSYGALWAAHITNDGLVLCYEEGYKFLGNVSDKLKEALKSTRYNVYRIKFTSRGSYFFADKDGHYTYWM